MATNFPGSLDSFTNPTSGSTLDSPSHAGQHANINDAVEALEAKVGVDGSAVTTSLDYKVDRRSLIWLDDQYFAGYGGVSSDVLSDDFTHYMVQFYGKVTSGSSGIYLRFRRSGADLTSSNYSWGCNGVTHSSGTAFTVSGSPDSGCRLGSIYTSGSDVSMFITRGFDNGAGASATWQQHNTIQTYNGSGSFNDGTAVTGFTIYRTANLAQIRVRVYGIRN